MPMTLEAKEIQLTKGMVALVDADDYEWLVQWPWHADRSKGGRFYACRSRSKKPRRIRMHLEILKPAPGMLVDHINRNSLDNRKSNLRLASRKQNVWNSKTPSVSGYKGVRRIGQKWVSYISLGTFDTAEEAAKEYDRVAKILRGEFAYTNYQ